MLRRNMVGTALVGLMLVAGGCATNEETHVEREMSAVAPQTQAAKVDVVVRDAKEVAFPKLPNGAGKIDEKAAKTYTTTDSGLKYRILREGPGAKPTSEQSVEVNYHGWLEDEKVFDSSYKRGESITFGLNQVIAGWTEGMKLVGEGGMIELLIPGDLAYGPGGRPGIPPNATLHFIVELIDVQ